MNKWLFRRALAVVLALLALTGCSGIDGITGDDSSSDDEATVAKVRLVNLTTASDLLLTVDDSALIQNIGSGGASAYAELAADSYSVVVSSASAALTATSTASLSLSAAHVYTLVAYERGGQIKFFSWTDETGDDDTDIDAVSGYTYLTVMNAGSDAGMLDVYLVTPGTSLDGLSANFSSISAASISLTSAISAGTYDIVVTASNRQDDVRLKLESVVIGSAEIATLVLTNTTGGALVNGAMIKKAGDVAFYRTDKARVRVIAAQAAGISSNIRVQSWIGDTELTAISAPSISSYQLVEAGTSEYDVDVDGVQVADLPTANFVSGADYTLLVYGNDASAAAVTVLTDNNQLPSTGVRIRLINGAVAAAGLSLSANYANLFPEVAYGTASGYTGISAGTTRLDLSSPAYAFTSYTSTVNMLTGGVYSMLVLGSSSEPIILLNKDR